MTLQRLLIGGVIAAVLAVAAVAGGWWFFIREDAEIAADPRDIPEELAQATAATDADGATPSGDVLTFRIIPEESEAAYFVDEELASLPLPSTARGATNAIEGEFYLTADGTAVAPGTESTFTVDLTSLDSDEDRRDNRVQQALETDQFPIATFTATGVSKHDASLPQEEQQTFLLTGMLDLHGVQREVTWEVEGRREGDLITALATVTFNFADFGIAPPNIAGFVSVSDEATLQAQIIAERV